MSGNKRVMKELGEITNSPPAGCKIRLPDDNDVLVWEVKMDGPAESIYAGGHFTINIILPKEYPFKPPTVSFRTKIYHPNVTNDDKGAMCLGMLRADEWKPPNKIKDVLELVRAILKAPQPDDAVEGGIAQQYKDDRAAFNKVAKDWVTKYAK